MAKLRTKYICSECGYETIKWLGKCPTCDNWNTFTEELVEDKKREVKKYITNTETFKLSYNSNEKEVRLKTNIEEFDRVLGGGLISGSVILLGGDPGIGKSTLVLQAASKINASVLYVTGEESLNQISGRAKRLKVNPDSISVLPETNLDYILSAIEKEDPKFVIIDSIQTIYKPDLQNAAGTITQIRESTSELMKLAKSKGCSIIVVGHVTKDGMIAGPKVLEHIVDTVLQFEGEKNHSYRILRSQKNRFGSTNEIGIFDMNESGLEEVKNPSEIFLSSRETEVTGSVITCSIEGSRPILLEVQALVTPSAYGNPQRVTTGFDIRRLSILLAVLEKRAGFRLSNQNVFLNIAGGIKIDEPAIDLAVCAAVASNFKDKFADSKAVVLGEVGLGGEVRSISNIEKRIQEAEKLGFEKIIVPTSSLKSIKSKNKIKIIGSSDISSALNHILRN